MELLQLPWQNIKVSQGSQLGILECIYYVQRTYHLTRLPVMSLRAHSINRVENVSVEEAKYIWEA